MSYYITQPNVNATKCKNSLEIIDFTISNLAKIFELRLRLKSARLEKFVLFSGKSFQARATR